jgi:hypothetical protein
MRIGISQVLKTGSHPPIDVRTSSRINEIGWCI